MKDQKKDYQRENWKATVKVFSIIVVPAAIDSVDSDTLHRERMIHLLWPSPSRQVGGLKLLCGPLLSRPLRV